MPAYESVYGSLMRLGFMASPFLERGGSKLARGLRGRRAATERLVGWAGEGRRPGQGLVWFHAPSVGEGLQARVVLAALAERAAVEGRPLETVFTHFSPSAEALAASMPVDVAAYLPWDVPSAVGPVLDALHPDLVVFTKTEVWPVMSREARRRGIPTALVAATLPEGSSRLRWPTREVLRPSVRRLASVLAIGEEDAARFRRLGAHDERVYVTGDPAIDSAVQRAGQANPDATYLRPFREYGREHGRPTVVAGSTWPADEAVLLPACARVRAFVEDVRLIVAPHEPTGSHVAALERRLALDGWRVGRLGDVEAAGTAEDVDAVVVDRVGVLAHLYTVADVAYVGGGFHGAG
ncbi:MAG TPA: glycosyltransferase N-terminal domain-containing protein, partial [Longimicrobiales bacterium]